MNSKRKYRICVCDQIGMSVENMTLHTINDSKMDAEYIYAMCEIIDEILDLRVEESMYFQSNRDNKNAKGIIYRIS